MNHLKLYAEFCIKPIEQKRDELRYKSYSNKLKYLLHRKIYREALEKTEKLLFECYATYSKYIDEELEFNKKMKEEIECKKKDSFFTSKPSVVSTTSTDK